jgi:UDP-N-acetylglucosamine 2-epimerase (non-hydrolysing)
MHILHVVGARPNFMKASAVIRALAGRESVHQSIVHTGQHYDAGMSDVFFQELDIPKPDVNLEVGSGSHAQQTAAVISRFEPVVLESKPDMVLVYGDVNSSLAAALVCCKLDIPVGQVEAGLRSFDRLMPEEINRLLTDQMASVLFIHSPEAKDNLLREGIAENKIRFPGNVMIDTLVRLLPQAQDRFPALASQLGLTKFGLVTLHRPSNVDDPALLTSLFAALGELSGEIPLIFPIHPRTRARISAQLSTIPPTLQIIEPLSYLDFLALESRALLVITDSGGVQEESTYLQVPCITTRRNTERPVTVTAGTNTLVGQDTELLKKEVRRVLAGQAKRGAIPPLWDGHAGSRIADELVGGQQ